MKYELIIIGGGASGLAAAVTAASLGLKRIAVLEQLPRIGKKLLATGNGRCNLSHTDISGSDYRGTVSPDEILKRFGKAPAFFENLGLFCRADAQGRLYPNSMTAASVLDAFRLRLEQDGTEILCDQKVTALEHNGKDWLVQAQEAMQAGCVIFAAGGHAAPKLGTDGSAWKLLEKLGIPIVSPRPILCPLRSEEKLLRPLKGIRLKGSVTLFNSKKKLVSEEGEIQFNEGTISGICVFDLTGKIDYSQLRGCELSVNCFPEADAGELLSRLYTVQAVRSEAICGDLLSGLVHRTVGKVVLKRCGILETAPCSSLSGAQLHAIANTLCDLRFPVTGTGDFGQAQATAGGVHVKALDADLQVKARPGLFITGEAADIQSICGGYHLHWCWASGSAAAYGAVKRIMKGEGA